jgi:hypothetical protein
MSKLDSMFLVAGVRLIRTGMVVQLATVKQERNSTILKVIEKEGALMRLSELEQVRASQEQDATTLSQTRDALCKSKPSARRRSGTSPNSGGC